MAPRARTESWTDTLTGCINDVVIMRPENPLETIGRLLADSSARPNWKETAAAYAKRHDIHNRLAIGLDQAGINPREAPPKDVLALLSAALLFGFCSNCFHPSLGCLIGLSSFFKFGCFIFFGGIRRN